MDTHIALLETQVTRLGIVLEPSGDPAEAAGVLNPGATRARDGTLLLYPREVAAGSVSRIGLAAQSEGGGELSFIRAGVALEPAEPYELRSTPGGFGCEDPRVTFIPLIDAYVMAYTAFGPDGPRIALALSGDGYAWRRLGLADFSAAGLPRGDDKDAALFPEPVISPAGVTSLAFYHRPMTHISAVDGHAAVPLILNMPAHERELVRIAYVPLEPVLADPANMVKVAESVPVLEPANRWGRVKNGAGTPPVRIEEGWMSLFHGVDAEFDAGSRCTGLRYSAGIVIHDAERPHVVLYRSPEPVLVPESDEERRGVVSDIVFPTGIDVASKARSYDVYYGMADARIGRARLALGASAFKASDAQESAA